MNVRDTLNASHEMRKKRLKSLRGAVLGILVLYGGFFLAMWRIGLFDLDTTGSDARVIAAVLTLSGGVFAASLTLIGVLLKHSIDDRTATLAEQAETRLTLDTERSAKLAQEAEERLGLEAERASSSAHEAEARLRLEASIRAVELLTLDSGDPAPRTQQAGALFVLTSLDQYALAVALLEELWREGNVSNSAAVEVINQALLSGVPYVQLAAGYVLLEHAESLPEKDTEGGNMPACIAEGWPTEQVSTEARWALLDAIIRALMSRSETGWRDNMSFAVWVARALDRIRNEEPVEGLRANAHIALNALLQSSVDFGTTWLTDHGEIDIQALRTDVASSEAEVRSLALDRYSKWADQIRNIG